LGGQQSIDELRKSLGEHITSMGGQKVIIGLTQNEIIGTNESLKKLVGVEGNKVVIGGDPSKIIENDDILKNLSKNISIKDEGVNNDELIKYINETIGNLNKIKSYF
jgi:hypothetical protein